MPYFEDNDTLRVLDSLGREHSDDLLVFIMSKGCSWPSEIARECDLNFDLVNRSIFNLKKEGKLQKTHAAWNPNPVIRCRIDELNMQGTIGFAAFQQISWWTLTPQGFSYIQKKYKGRHLRAPKGLMDFFWLDDWASDEVFPDDDHHLAEAEVDDILKAAQA